MTVFKPSNPSKNLYDPINKMIQGSGGQGTSTNNTNTIGVTPIGTVGAEHTHIFSESDLMTSMPVQIIYDATDTFVNKLIYGNSNQVSYTFTRDSYNDVTKVDVDFFSDPDRNHTLGIFYQFYNPVMNKTDVLDKGFIIKIQPI